MLHLPEARIPLRLASMGCCDSYRDTYSAAPTAVEVDARKHREALLRTLLARIESEHGIEEDPEAREEARAAAKARIGQLTDLMVRVEEAGS
jgi:hypothetical protein